ncbi:hypothetical protein F2Q70_00039271 [Brassica cretica]|uniref:Zinc knuckle CX2CX4HX4C domain-containing protein n=1 Tax=Brassica cretica TaxID=69181 RepID=A0A8S9K1T3_BRACR|nr:hypothetical protein F2Q70_00039271 [Brassica cretica]
MQRKRRGGARSCGSSGEEVGGSSGEGVTAVAVKKLGVAAVKELRLCVLRHRSPRLHIRSPAAAHSFFGVSTIVLRRLCHSSLASSPEDPDMSLGHPSSGAFTVVPPTTSAGQPGSPVPVLCTPSPEDFPSPSFCSLRTEKRYGYRKRDLKFGCYNLELGSCYVKDVKEAKIWVEVNGLKPLVMQMEIELPTEDNDVMEVEFEYIKIEKNLFTCFSLFHEEVDCPRRHPNALPPKERALVEDIARVISSYFTQLFTSNGNTNFDQIKGLLPRKRSDGESLPRSLWMRPHLTLLSVEENEHCRPSTKILSSESMAVSPAIEEELDHGDAKGRDLGEALLAEQPLSKKLEAEEEELEHEKGGRSVLVLE